MKIITVDFQYLENNNYPSVTDYCRFLTAQDDEDWSDCVIHVSREGRVCLIVNDIYEASKMMPKDCRWIKYDKTRRKGVQEPH